MRRVDEIDFFFFWRNLCKHYLWILGAGVVCAVITFLVCFFLIRPTYQAEIKLFAWGDQSITTAPQQGNYRTPNAQGITIQDLNLANLLVNDYQELLASRSIQEESTKLLNAEHPELADIPYHFDALVQPKTRFIKIFVYSHSAPKAKAAAQTLARVFTESLESIMKTNRVQIVDDAEILGQVSPKTFLATLLAFLLGGGVVFGVFCFLDFFRYTLRNSEVVKDELDLPTLGTIGLCSSKENPNLACLPTDRKNYRFNHIVEDFLLLQTNLQYSLPHKNTAQILMLTSSFPKDGKSFTSLNLALTLSGNSKKVLLINCDLRKIEYDYLNLPRQPGLVNFLLGEKTIDEVIHPNVLGTTLSVIRCGPIPPNPTRMLELFRDSGVLRELEKRYDYIILDSPPCMNMADPLLLSKLADGAMLIANSRRTPVEAARRVVEQLCKVDANLLGVVLNRYSAQNAGYGYGYGYGYGENQSSKSSKSKRAHHAG